MNWPALGHDLRTPLSVMNGDAQLLRSGELSPEQRARACDLILEKCEELNAVIRRLVDQTDAERRPPVPVEQTAQTLAPARSQAGAFEP